MTPCLRARRTATRQASSGCTGMASICPVGNTTLRADAQTLLGEERRVDRINEALDYVGVATTLEEEGPPDCQYINLRNGRLDWATGALEPHTPAFSPRYSSP